ncbi:GNAT family N-acetyltransferase [Sinimarinibacterium flocculans]|uniref:ElaA protein n=1 Tax=Sinimarinibacterium flocculans TaxID=985250 RepID=A0A318EBW6_9GAMM|nr:GNAT family N-acetyltransferase [Sinimarinibacterium flocculans]PXV67235.1 ElaA protein [Sinimarinibacterium flocculans]
MSADVQTPPTGLRWQWIDWPGFDPDTLYALLKLRSDIFVVEQNCAYPDMDGLDPQCRHLVGRDGNGAVQAGLRLVPPGVKHAAPALGRLVVAPSLRGTGLGRALMRAGLEGCQRWYPGQRVFLSGQQHLEDFYRTLGFETVSAPYLEDGIPHVDMLRPA